MVNYASPSVVETIGEFVTILYKKNKTGNRALQFNLSGFSPVLTGVINPDDMRLSEILRGYWCESHQ